jgi:hypothetical protein
MRFLATATAILLLGPLAFVAEAQVPGPFMDGEELKEGLEAWESSWDSLLSDRTLDSGVAFGFVVGVADARDGEGFCLPGSVSRKQLGSLVLQHLRKQSGLEEQRASRLTLEALEQAYPCRR